MRISAQGHGRLYSQARARRLRQRIFEALERIAGESRDKIDIYIFKPALLGESIRRKEIRRCVLSADRFEHGIVEGLGVYAYSVDRVGAQYIELLLRYGIWSAEFDGIFAYSGQIEAVFYCRADLSICSALRIPGVPPPIYILSSRSPISRTIFPVISSSLHRSST